MAGCISSNGQTHPERDSVASSFAPVVLPNTETRYLYSDSVGITYKLYMSIPKSYIDGNASYPVVYMLDADYSFAIARNIVEHLTDRDDLPEMILVGIAYDGPLRYRLNRTRDYTPTFVPDDGYGPEYQKHSGGGPDFRAFIKNELIPFMDANYRTRDERTFVGHSYGGLFGSWVMFTEPELFDHYILVSPSLWYDNRLIFRLESEYASKHKQLSAKVYFTVGSHEWNSRRNMVTDLRDFTTQVRAHAYSELKIAMKVMEDETHNSVFPAGLSDGLRYLYPDE